MPETGTMELHVRLRSSKLSPTERVSPALYGITILRLHAVVRPTIVSHLEHIHRVSTEAGSGFLGGSLPTWGRRRPKVQTTDGD